MKEIENTPLLFDESECLGCGREGTRTAINRIFSFQDRAGVRVVFYWHEPIFRFPLSDKLSLRHAAVSLRLGNLATQDEVSRAFQHSVATQRRWENQYQANGLEGLIRGKSSGRPSGIPQTLDGVLRTWFEQGVSNREMAHRLKVSEAAIHRALARLGLHRRKQLPAVLSFTEISEESVRRDSQGGNDAASAETAPEAEEASSRSGDGEFLKAAELCVENARVEIPAEEEHQVVGECGISDGGESPRSLQGSKVLAEVENAVPLPPVFGERLEDVLASYEEKGFSIDRDPDDRTGDRGLARAGLLEDALPLFGDRPCLRQAGVLLAIPLLVESGLIDVFVRVYHSLAPAFYGLRTTVVVLFLSALLRIKRPEHIKEHNPQELGHVVGLDRFPEVKTVHRKLDHLAALKLARELMLAMAQRRIGEDAERAAFLYADGHVRVYHGQHPLAKTKKSQHQVAKPAATDTWVHDANGEPLLVVTSEMNEGLTQVLEPILADVKSLIGDRRVLVIFDRGGFSPKLFARLDKQGFDVMTYRKGKTKPWPVSEFHDEEYVVEGRCYQYQLAERKRVKVGRLRLPRKRKARRSDAGPQFLWMREVRVLRDDGRQTAILTSSQGLNKEQVPYRQFQRWRQENYFKYMDAEYELDALVEYGVEDVSEEADRPNPSRRPLERALVKARAQVQRLQAELGAPMSAGQGTDQRTVRGFKIAHAELRARLAEAEAEVAGLQAELEQLPRRISAAGLKTLKTEKKLIADTIKMTAYQVETRLLGMLNGVYCRNQDEGRTLLQAAFQSTARMEVREGELYVELAPQSSPHRTKAIGELCAKLNALGAKFPGTCLRLQLAIQPHQPLKKL
jgi:prepilin-type processing-associated H-X9-DG protein